MAKKARKKSKRAKRAKVRRPAQRKPVRRKASRAKSRKLPRRKARKAGSAFQIMIDTINETERMREKRELRGSDETA
jgi:hypothetical protein